jgi:hypothetical protein
MIVVFYNVLIFFRNSFEEVQRKRQSEPEKQSKCRNYKVTVNVEWRRIQPILRCQYCPSSSLKILKKEQVRI